MTDTTELGDLYDGPCEAGCKSFHGGEKKHHPDCGHYPESLTKLNADRIEELQQKLAEVEAERDHWETVAIARQAKQQTAEARIAHLENHIEAVAKDTHKIMVAYEAALVAACGTLRKIANGPDNAEPELWAAQALYTAAELMARIQTGETDNGMA